MISVLLFFFLASGVFPLSNGKYSPLPAEVILCPSILAAPSMILVTEVARITLRSQLSLISPAPFIGTSSVCPSTITLTYTGPACTPTLLPIDLIHFNVDLQPEEISFEWMTLSEKNASHFEIEYSSDAVLFEKIAVVKAKGQSTEMTKYQKNIANHFDETGLYFRLKSVDGNGDFSYSPIVYLSYDIRSSFKVGPNPSANGVFVIKQGIRSGSSFQFEIYNAKGVMVKKGQLNQTQTEIDLSEYGSGMHLLHLSAGSQSAVYKLISQ